MFANANPDTPGKLLAHALSYEALEEASYALLVNVAESAGDSEVAETADRIGREEVAMTSDEFEDLRKRPGLFVVLPDHWSPEHERLLYESSRVHVVDTIGRSTERDVRARRAQRGHLDDAATGCTGCAVG